MERDPMQIHVVVDVVMKYLRVRDLLICRLVSKAWNERASSVLRKRDTIIKRISDERCLLKLQRCMKKNRDFPFVGLKFDQPWLLNSDRATKFFQKYGEKFTRLCLETSWEMRLTRLAPFINLLTRLSILEMSMSKRPFYSAVSDVLQDDGNILEIASVQIIRIQDSQPCYTEQVKEDILREILASASPLVQVECLETTPEILRVLKSTGKIGAISSININETCSRLPMDQYLPTGSLSLTKLEYRHWTNEGGCRWTGLVYILLSSQNTLKELCVDGMHAQEYSWDRFPILEKLTKLSLGVPSDGCLFQGEHGHKLPALRELQLNLDRWRSSSFSLGGCGANVPGLFVVPRVTTIELKGKLSENGMKVLAQTFPNVLEIRLDYSIYTRRQQHRKDAYVIWSVREFNCLERLKIWNVIVKKPSKHYIHMDSFLTGIPIEICKNFLLEEKLNLVDSPMNRILRVNPNLSQLPNLKELVVCVTYERAKELPQDGTPFMSMLSVWYALEMMPNLRARFVYEDVSKPSRKDKQKKAMLEAAFKHVKDHIKLEPYLY